jgi:ankyrin repeat protein
MSFHYTKSAMTSTEPNCDFISLVRADSADAIHAFVEQFGADGRVLDPSNRCPAILQKNPPLLSVCCFYGSIRCIELLLSYEPNPSLPDNAGRCCYHFAAAGNRVDALSLVSHLFPDVKSLMSPDSQRKTILHYAAEWDSIDIFRYCFPRIPAEAFDADSAQGTPLLLACRRPSIRCFEFLASLNIDAMSANLCDRMDCRLPINFNFQIGAKGPLTFLLTSAGYSLIPLAAQAGMDPNEQMMNGWPALFHAVRCGSPRFVEVLCRFGANVNYRCESGWTAMHIAAQDRKPEMCRILAKFGGNPLIASRFGRSPFVTARAIDPDDPRRETARTIRDIIVDTLARMLMRKCAEKMTQPITEKTMAHASLTWSLSEREWDGGWANNNISDDRLCCAE